MAKVKHISKKRRIIYIVLGTILLALIIFRLLLPGILLRYVNKQLTLIDGYRGHVEDIDVSLYRGAYTIKQIKLDKTGGGIPVPFFNAQEIDLSIEWNALFNGRIVAEIEVEKPVLNFVSGPTKATSQTDIDNDWTTVVDNLIPFKLNRFKINNGEVHYRDYHSSPKVDIKATNVEILAENLSNAKRVKNALPSPVTASASVYGAKATMDMKIDPLARNATFDMNTRLTTVDITKFNDFLKAYGNFDAEKGTISLYSEAAAKDKKITGYVKPVIKDLKVLSWKNDKENPVQLAWEAVVGAVSWLLTNHPKDQVATRADFTGSLDNPDFNTWSIVGQLLRNAFIEALYPSLENSVTLNSVDKKEEKQGFFKRLFGGKKKDKQQ